MGSGFGAVSQPTSVEFLPLFVNRVYCENIIEYDA
jgi:hypothetical protein